VTHQQLAPDSVDMRVLHGTHAGPALPVGSQFRVPRHITARDDDLGIALQHGLYRYRRRQVRQVGKNIAAATQPDDITDKVIAIDCHQGLLPYLVKHAYRRSRGIAVTELLMTLIKQADRLRRPGPVTGQPAKALQAAGNIGNELRFGHEHGNPQLSQALHLSGRAAAAPGNHQLRPQRQDRLEIEATAAANLRYRPRRRGIVAVFGCTDDGITGTDRKQQLGYMRRQADDAAGRALKDHWLAAVVDHTDFRTDAAPGQQPEQDGAEHP